MQYKQLILSCLYFAFEDLCREWVLVQACGPASVANDQAWRVHYIYFARAGFTEAACAEAESTGARLVDLPTLDADLRRALG